MKVSTPTTLAPTHYSKSSGSAIGGQMTVVRSAEGSLIEVSDDAVVGDLAGAVLDGEDLTDPGVYVHDCSCPSRSKTA